MRPGISSKHSEKNSDEVPLSLLPSPSSRIFSSQVIGFILNQERSKKKKTKSNKRRRHDFSSSSSYSSDLEIDARSGKWSGRRVPKRQEKKRKGSKKPVKKKSLKTYRRDAGASSPSSYSSRSCSTCRSWSSSSRGSENNSGRSRSPLARAKRRAK